MSAPVVVLTNRHNVLEYLSSGMVAPRAGIPKYYRDLLAFASERDVIGLRAPLSADVVALAVEEAAETNFPVALELDVTRLTSRALDCISIDGAIKPRPVTHDGTAAWVGTGPISMDAVTRMHFRSQRDADEHLAREYQNVAADRAPVSVTPALFTGGSLSAEALKAWLATLAASPSEPEWQYTHLDRVRGAQLLALTTSPGRTAWLRDILKAVTPTSAAAPSKGTKKAKRTKSKITNVESGAAPPWLVSGLTSIASGTPSSNSDFESRLFAAALSVFMRTDREVKWRPLAVLSEIETWVSRDTSAGSNLELAKNIESIRLILNNDRDFKPLNTGKGLDAAKALLMALLRPDAERLLSWERERSGADDAVHSAAATLVGALSGYRLLPISLRRRGLDTFLEKIAVSRLSTGGDRDWMDPPMSDAFEVEVHETRQGDTGSVTVAWKRDTILEVELAPASLRTRLLDLDVASGNNVALLTRIATLLGWTDCMRTTIVLPSPEFSVAMYGKGRQIGISTVGVVQVETSLELAAFRAKLESEGVPLALESDVRGLLESHRIP